MKSFLVFQDHPVIHPIQEWHFRGEPDQADPTRPDPARGDGHHQHPALEDGEDADRGALEKIWLRIMDEAGRGIEDR